MPADVVLHIYDVGSAKALSSLNSGLRVVGTGAFHGAVEVYGAEWSYGYCDEGPGVFDCPPKGCTAHSYRESVPMGQTSMSETEVKLLLKQLEGEWPGEEYDLLRRNCCVFSDEFCKRLGVGAIPGWVTNLAGAGATLGYHAGNALSAVQIAGIIAAARANEVDEKYKIKGTVEAKAKEMFGHMDKFDKQYKVTDTVATAAWGAFDIGKGLGAGLVGAVQKTASEGTRVRTATEGERSAGAVGSAAAGSAGGSGYAFGDFTRGLFSQASGLGKK